MTSEDRDRKEVVERNVATGLIYLQACQELSVMNEEASRRLKSETHFFCTYSNKKKNQIKLSGTAILLLFSSGPSARCHSQSATTVQPSSSSSLTLVDHVHFCHIHKSRVPPGLAFCLPDTFTIWLLLHNSSRPTDDLLPPSCYQASHVYNDI